MENRPDVKPAPKIALTQERLDALFKSLRRLHLLILSVLALN